MGTGQPGNNDVHSVIIGNTELCQLLSFEDEPDLLRATDLNEVTCRAGSVLDTRRGLGMRRGSSTAAADPEEDQVSRPKPATEMPPDMRAEATEGIPVFSSTRINTFISHNWQSGRWEKYMAVCTHFNLHWGLSSAVGVASLCYLWRFLAGKKSWYGLLHLTATPAMLLVTFMLRNWASLCRLKGPSVFLDVCCISQTDQALQQRGIQKLGAFMHSSDRLLVCYSPQLYLKRLWTVYEMCTYLVVRQGQIRHMSIVPLDLPPFALACSLLMWTWGVLYLCLTILSYEGKPEELTENLLGSSLMASGAIFCAFAMVILPARSYFLRLERMLSEVGTFDVRTAECSCEEDRAYVEAAIVQLMRHVEKERSGEVSTETLLDDFNNLVRNEVPKAIRRSTGSIGIPLKHVVILCGVPMSTVAMENSAYFDLGDSVAIVRSYTVIIVWVWVLSRLCTRHSGLSGAARVAYLFAVCAANTLVGLVLMPAWDTIILVHMTYSNTLRMLGHILPWFRCLLGLVLTCLFFPCRCPWAKEIPTTLRLVSEPEPDTFFL